MFIPLDKATKLNLGSLYDDEENSVILNDGK